MNEERVEGLLNLLFASVVEALGRVLLGDLLDRAAMLSGREPPVEAVLATGEHHREKSIIQTELQPNLLDPFLDGLIVLLVVTRQGELDRLQDRRLPDEVILNQHNVDARAE